MAETQWPSTGSPRGLNGPSIGGLGWPRKLAGSGEAKPRSMGYCFQRYCRWVGDVGARRSKHNPKLHQGLQGGEPLPIEQFPHLESLEEMGHAKVCRRWSMLSSCPWCLRIFSWTSAKQSTLNLLVQNWLCVDLTSILFDPNWIV